MSITHFSGPVAVGQDSYESLIATKVLDKDDNGKTFGLNLAGGFTVTLPAVATVNAGWKARFRVETNPTTAYIITEKAVDDANIILGSINTSTGQTTAADFEVSGATFVTFVAGVALVSDWVTIETNGINWFVYGQTTVPTGITIT